MSGLLGSYQQVTKPATPTGGANGINFPLGNTGWAKLVSLVATIVTSATAGNRIPVLQIFDVNNNLIWASAQGGNIAASITTSLIYGAGVSAFSVSAGGVKLPAQQAPLPIDFAIPPNSSITLVDAAHISATDTFALNAILCY